MAGVHIRALTAPRPIKPTSPRCHSAWQPNPGRGSTYRRGKSVQTTGTTSVGVAKQLQQILVLSHVERGFGAEAEFIIVLVLILLEEGEQLLGNRQVSNQI